MVSIIDKIDKPAQLTVVYTIVILSNPCVDKQKSKNTFSENLMNTPRTYANKIDPDQTALIRSLFIGENDSSRHRG